MKKLLIMAITLMIGLTFITVPGVYAEDIEALSNRIKGLEEKLEKQEQTSVDILGKLDDQVTFSGAIELDFSYVDPSDMTNPQSDSTSSLDIGTAELGAEVRFHKWVTGNFILKGEELDGDDDRVFWDEATITIQNEAFPLYFVGGKRGQPFGVFNSHLINDPITQDCYEINKTGATIGLTPDFLGIDISGTIYKGEVLADKVSEAGYGLARDLNPDPTDDVNSYIFNVSLAPIEGLNLSAFFDSEPGQGDRNKTAGGAIEYKISIFDFDLEYITALNREKNVMTNEEHKESAWFAAIACHVIDPLEIAARYEGFNDDVGGDQDGHLESRYSIGANYTLFKSDPFAATLMLEYRRSNYEKAVASTAHDNADEVFVRLAFEF